MSSSGRHPIAQFLALAVLGVAVGLALIFGVVVFATLFGIFVVGYLISFAHFYWRLGRLRSRAAYVDDSEADRFIEGELDLLEATADAAQRGSGGSA
jgi:hypothetical protein